MLMQNFVVVNNDKRWCTTVQTLGFTGDSTGKLPKYEKNDIETLWSSRVAGVLTSMAYWDLLLYRV